MPIQGFTSFSLADYDGELSGFSMRTAILSSGNITAQGVLRDAITNALYDVSLGQIQELRFGNVNSYSVDRPSDPLAQRELKWAIAYHDAVTLLRYTLSIPCANPARLSATNRPFADLSGAEIAGFVAALQAFMKSPHGNAIVVDSVRLVGRAV
jgi:hypothetical protein